MTEGSALHPYPSPLTVPGRETRALSVMPALDLA